MVVVYKYEQFFQFAMWWRLGRWLIIHYSEKLSSDWRQRVFWPYIHPPHVSWSSDKHCSQKADPSNCLQINKDPASHHKLTCFPPHNSLLFTLSFLPFFLLLICTLFLYLLPLIFLSLIETSWFVPSFFLFLLCIPDTLSISLSCALFTAIYLMYYLSLSLSLSLSLLLSLVLPPFLLPHCLPHGVGPCGCRQGERWGQVGGRESLTDNLLKALITSFRYTVTQWMK